MGRRARRKESSNSQPGNQGSRECSLCGMPQEAIEFSERSTPTPNCRRCERCYNTLHFHERLSMPIVRGNVYAYGGPALVIAAYKRKGLAALDLNLTISNRRKSGKSAKSEGNNGTDGAASAPAVEEDTRAVEAQAEEVKQRDAGAEEMAQRVSQGENSSAQDASKAADAINAKMQAGVKAEPDPLIRPHTDEDLEILNKHGRIKVVEVDGAKRFVYKRSPILM